MKPVEAAKMTPLELLTTTRSVRRRLDLTRPVPRELIRACLDIAIQAPTGGNRQDWHFLAIDSPELKAKLARYYARAHAAYVPRPADGAERLAESVDYLAEHLREVPALVIPMYWGRLPANSSNHQAAAFYGSIMPAVWSFMLAARLHGLGTSFTTMHLRWEREIADDLSIPHDRVTQVGLIATGFYTGETFRPARRKPVDEIIHWDTW